MGQNPRRWRLAAIPLPYVAMIITGVVLLMAMIWYMATTSGGEEGVPPVPTPPPAVETSLAPAETIQEAVMGDPGRSSNHSLPPFLYTFLTLKGGSRGCSRHRAHRRLGPGLD